MRISSEVLDQTRFMRHCRRALHWMPETGFELTQTRAYILEMLAEMEPDKLEQMGGGIRAVFCSPLSPEKKKAAIGFRSDMDALQVEERTGLSFASRNPGFMHGLSHRFSAFFPRPLFLQYFYGPVFFQFSVPGQKNPCGASSAQGFQNFISVAELCHIPMDFDGMIR